MYLRARQWFRTIHYHFSRSIEGIFSSHQASRLRGGECESNLDGISFHTLGTQSIFLRPNISLCTHSSRRLCKSWSWMIDLFQSCLIWFLLYYWCCTFLSALLSVKIEGIRNLTFILNFDAVRSGIHRHLIKVLRWMHCRHWHGGEAWIWLRARRWGHEGRIVTHHPVKSWVFEEVSALEIVK